MNRRSSWIAVAALAAAVALMYESCPSTGSAPAPAADRRVLALIGADGLPECQPAVPEPGAAFAPYLDAVLRRQAEPTVLEPCPRRLLGASAETPRVTRPKDTSPPMLPPAAPDDVSALLPARLDVVLAVAWAEL
jgi:hypothetical protein